LIIGGTNKGILYSRRNDVYITLSMVMISEVHK